MAGYTRQSTFADGDTITAALFNNEYNQLVNAFSNTSGHSHDGTAASGPVIGLIGDAGETSPNNKVLIDTTNNYIEFYVEVSSAPVQQLYIADGAIIPVTDSDIDLGTTSLRFKDTYTDTITTTGNVDVGGNLTVTGTTTFNGGTITMGDAATDNVVFGADVDSNIIPDDDDSYDLGSSSQEWRNLYIDGTANIDSLIADTADINGGTIDGATIATSDITVGSGKTLNVSAGTLTLADNQISGDKVEGGTIAATTITDLTYGSLNDGTITITAFADEDDMSSDSATLVPTQQSVKAYVDSQVTAQDLDFQGDSGGALSIDLDSESLTIAGGTGLDTVGSGNTVTVNIDATVATLTGSQTLTNKTIDVDNNTVSNIEVDNLKSGVLDTDLTSVAATDTTIASAKAIKTYVDAQVTAQDLDFAGDTGGALSIDLDSESLTIAGGTGIDTSGATNTLTVNIDSTVATLTGTQTLTNKTLTSPVINTGVSGTAFLDDDTFGTASATTLASSESIKAYVDTRILTEDTLAEMNDVNITSPADGALLFYDTGTSMWIDNVVSGDITIADTGVAAISSGVIVNDDINASAAISISKTALVGGTGLTLTGDTLSVDAAQTQITSVGTLGSLTVSGDVTVDTNTLKVDSTNNRVGILNATPDVSLDIGSATDAVHVPVGTTAQRPGSPAAGYFRYNTSLSQFEGYTDAWGAIGGGGTNTFTHDVFTGDGSTTAFALSQSTESENNLIVFIDGVFQEQSAYSIATASGVTTLTMSEAPVSGRKLVVYTVAAAVSGSNLNIDTMTGDGSDTTLTLSINPVNENNTQVFFDGVYQSKANYSISGTTLTFTTAPPTGTAVEVMTFTQTDINVPVDGTITSAKLSGNLVTPGNLDVTGTATMDGLTVSASAATANITSTSGGATLKLTHPTATDGYSIRQGNADANDFRIFEGSKIKLNINTGGDISFYDDTGTSQALFWDASAESLGIGTTSPHSFSKLHLEDSANCYFAMKKTGSTSAYLMTDGNTLKVASSSGTTGNKVSFSLTAPDDSVTLDSSGNVGIGRTSIAQPSSGATTLAIQGTSTTKGGAIRLYSSDDSVAAYIYPDSTSGLSINTSTSHPMVFRTVGAEAMRIDTSGNLLVGCTALDAQQGFAVEKGDATNIQIMHNFGQASGTTYTQFLYATGVIGSITQNGTTGVLYNTSSDARLKDITGSARGLEVINKLNPVAYNWKESGQADEGLIAQEVLDIVPNAVSGSEEDMYQMDYSKLVTPLIKAVQELSAEVDELKKQLENK